MKLRAWTLCVCSILGASSWTASWTLAGPIDDARALLSQGKLLEVDQALEPELKQRQPSIEALKLSMEAAVRSERIVTAEIRATALLKLTENKDADLLLSAARLSAMLGNDPVAMSRYLAYSRLVDQKGDDLREALRFILTREPSAAIYQRYVELFGKTEESFLLGQQLLDQLIALPDAKGALDIAIFIQESYPTPEQVAVVHRALYTAADAFTFGSTPTERYLPPLKAMMHGYATSTGWIAVMFRGIERDVPAADRLDLLLAYQEKYKKPMQGDILGQFNALSTIEDQDTRTKLARRYLALEPIYAADQNADYDQYIRVIFDRRETFLNKDNPLVTTAMANGFLGTYKKRYDASRWPTMIGYVRSTIADTPQTIAFYRDNLANLNSGQFNDLLALDESKNLATDLPAHLAGKSPLYSIPLRWSILYRLNQAGDKAGLLAAVRDGLTVYAGNFDANHLRNNFINSQLPTADEKIALLRQVITTTGTTPALQVILDGMAKSKEKPEDWGNLKAFQDLLSLAQSNPTPANPAAAALAALISIPEKSSQPDARVQKTVETFLAGYKGNIPGDDEQIKSLDDLLVRGLFLRHQWHVRDNDDATIAWAQVWAPRMPLGDFWQRLASELARRRAYSVLFDIAPRYVELTRNSNSTGDQQVWQWLMQASQKDQKPLAPFEGAYTQMGSRLATRFVFDRNGRFDIKARQAFLDELAKAVTAGGVQIDNLSFAEQLINYLSMWTRTSDPVARPSLALIQGAEQAYRQLAADNAQPNVLATVISLYRRNGYDAQAQANTKRFLDEAAAAPALQKANALGMLLRTDALPREAADFREAKTTQPGMWLNTAMELYLPAMQQVPPAQWPLVNLDHGMFGWLHPIITTPDHPLRAKAMQLSLLAADMAAGGANTNGNPNSLLVALGIVAREQIDKEDWHALNRTAGYIADIVGRDYSPEAQFNNYAQSLVPLLMEKGASEPLYAMLSRMERRIKGQETFVKRLQVAKSQAAANIANLIPVPPGDPLYDLYRASHFLSLGQEIQAWELTGTPARLELLTKNWQAFDEQFIAWTIEQLRKQKGDSLRRALDFCFSVLLEEPRLMPETAAKILLTRGDIYRDMQNYPAARLEYEGLHNNDRYRTTQAGIKATYRLVELHVLTRNYTQAEAMLQRMINSDDINTQAEAYYLYARIEFQRGNYPEAADYVRRVKERIAGHVEAALLEGELKPYIRGGMDNPIVEIGLKQLQTTLVPGRPLSLKLLDPNLSIARAGEAIPVILRTSSGKDEEHINLIPSSSNRNLFQASIPTALGQAQSGNMILEISGADTVSYVIDESFQKANNLDYPPKILEVRSDARLQASSEPILTRAQQEQRELERRLAEESQGPRALNVSRDSRTIRPGSVIYVQVNDPDRDISDAPDTIAVDLRTTSGDVLEKYPLTETGPHTGIFEATVPTSIPLPRADASDTDVSSNQAFMIRTGSDKPWVSRADAIAPKWIEVDTMTSSQIASASVEIPDIANVRSMTMLGDLSDGYSELASYPARPDASRGGLMLDVAPDNRGERPEQIQRHLRLAPLTSQWQQSPVFDRSSIPTATSNRWITTRLRGTFYMSEPQAIEFKLLNQAIDHLAGYVLIDDQLILGGSLRRAPNMDPTQRIELSAGPHTLEIISTSHLPPSSIVLGYRIDKGEFAPVPADWFSVEAHPELAEILKPRATLSVQDNKAILKFNTPQRMRKFRLVFNEFSGMSLSAGKFTLTDVNGKNILPVAEDFTQGLTNRTLEIAPGDEITVNYTDTLRLLDGEQTLQTKLNSSFHNGTIALANEVIQTVGDSRRIDYLPAQRIRVGDQVVVIVTDFDMDTTDGRDSVQVRAKSSSGHEITLQALETSINPLDGEQHHRHTGRFVAILKFADHPAADTLQIKPADRITVSYLDSENTNPGVPVERTFAASESGDIAPEIMVYRSSITMVPDNSLEAQAVRRRLASARDESAPALYKPQPLVRHPDYVPQGTDATTQPKGVISSVAAPILWEVSYPKMALHQGSVLNVTLVAESELQAAQREGRQPRTLSVPMTLESIDHLARSKGYPIQLSTNMQRSDVQMLRDGVFAGIARLQIGSPNDPIDDMVVFDSSTDPKDMPRITNDDSAYRIPTLLVSGSDVVHIRVEDPDRKNIVQTAVELRSQARMELLDASYRVQQDTIHLGETFWLRVTDPDRDRTDERDQIKVAASGSNGDRITLTLSETLPHSGVFTTSFTPKFIGEKVDGKLPTPTADDDTFSVFFGEKVTFSYVDEMPLDAITPQTIETIGHIHLGSDAQLATFSKQFKDRDIAVKTQFLMAEALFEMAKERRKIGQTDQAHSEIIRGKNILEEALRDYPDSALAAQGDYLLANLAQELGNYGEAISRYSTVISTYPDSEYAPEAQFKKALCYELQDNFDQASEEYVKLTYIYPNHALVADATIRLGNHYYKQKDYKVAGRIFYQFYKKNPTHRLAPQALLLSGHCAYQLLEFKEATARLSALVESYLDEKDVRAEALYWLADSIYQEGNYVRSYQTFKKLTWDYPDNKWSKFARGRLTDKAFMNAEETQ